MTRLAPLEPPFAPEVQASFDRIMPPGAAPLALFRTLARSERAWKRFRAGSLLADSPLTLRQREIVILRTCARSGCSYEWGVHALHFAGAARLSEQDLAALEQVPFGAAGWGADEAALVVVADALHERATLTDEELGRLRTSFDDAQVLEVLMLCGFYRTVAYLANGLALGLEPGTTGFGQRRPVSTLGASSPPD